ncbi:MAG TPA: ATP-binding protein [Candidatus Acidoferrales bacterium]|nr:ATP-binding protein [Candidatus Acidoferrales bacterium]
MMRLNFRTKVLVPVIAVMVVLVAVTVYLVNRRLMLQFQTAAQNTLSTADTVFQNLQSIHSDDLLTRFHGLVNEPLYVAVFPTADPATLHDPLQKLLDAEQDVAIVLYSTNAANVLASELRDTHVLSPGDFASAAGPAVKQALHGRPTVDTVSANDRLYEVISIPVYNTYKTLIGALTLGSEIGAGDAMKFSEITRSQIALFAGGRVIASTLANSSGSAGLATLIKDPSWDARVRQVPLGDAHYFYVVGRFNSLSKDTSIGYVLLSSYEDSLFALKDTQRVLALASLCAILIGGAVIWLLISKVTAPLRELRDSAEAVGRGDYSRRVPVHSTDECGELAATFNTMTENVRQSRAELEKTVETLKSTQEQLIQSEKLSAVGEFVAGVAHELNNPLAAVTGFAELLRESNIHTEYRRQLDLVFKAAQRCQKIVQSLLSFARRHPVERKPVSANELVEAVLEIVAYPLRTSNVEVTTNLDPNLPMVMADGHQIQQVLLNIVNNARQALEAHQRGGKITISTTVIGSNVRCTIQDNGPGIAPENLRRIFDPFFTTKEVGKGTGLGLSLCYGIIKEHGGDIRVESSPGKGATFYIELPLAQGAGNAASKSVAPEKIAPDPREGAGKKILVIDDEDAILQMVSESLTRSGYQVEAVTDGQTGLRRLKQDHYDVALCDWKMPGLNGRQVYDQLGASRPDLCRRIIFITGDVINEQMRDFLKTENRPCLGKPFALDDLRTTIKTTLEGL